MMIEQYLKREQKRYSLIKKARIIIVILVFFIFLVIIYLRFETSEKHTIFLEYAGVEEKLKCDEGVYLEKCLIDKNIEKYDLLFINNKEATYDEFIYYQSEDTINVKVIKVDKVYDFETEVIKFQIEEKKDNTLMEGETKLDIKGIDGEKLLIYQVIYHNGILYEKVQIKEKITNPTNQVVLVGTKVVSTTNSINASEVKRNDYKANSKKSNSESDEKIDNPSNTIHQEETIEEKCTITINGKEYDCD